MGIVVIAAASYRYLNRGINTKRRIYIKRDVYISKDTQTCPMCCLNNSETRYLQGGEEPKDDRARGKQMGFSPGASRARALQIVASLSPLFFSKVHFFREQTSPLSKSDFHVGLQCLISKRTSDSNKVENAGC